MVFMWAFAGSLSLYCLRRVNHYKKLMHVGCWAEQQALGFKNWGLWGRINTFWEISIPSLLACSHSVLSVFSFLSCTISCSFSIESFLSLYKHVLTKIPLVPNSFQITLLLFCTYSWPNMSAFSSSFVLLIPYLDPTLTAPLRHYTCQEPPWLPWSKLSGHFSILALCDLSGTQLCWYPLLFVMLSFLGFPLLVFSLPSNGYCFSISSIDPSSWTKSKGWTWSGFGLNWVLSLSFSPSPPQFLGQGARAILGKTILCCVGCSLHWRTLTFLVSRHLNPI